ncbi:MAG TPA: DJ-1 family glyoxalase III [Treponemataceae bacterium]|nr:DJ-1 family glyoxalase III [Treponemataceae bacterium]
MKTILILMADGCEEIEALAPVNILRRAKLNVQTVACTGSSLMIEGAHNIFFTCDILLSQIVEKVEKGDLPDAVVCPGGLVGSENLAKSSGVKKILQSMDAAGRIISANCAAPVMVFGKNGLLKGRKYTCYPGMQKQFKTYAPQAAKGKSDSGKYINKPIVVDSNMLTARGPGASFLFGLKLVELLTNHQKAKEIKDGMVIDGKLC